MSRIQLFHSDQAGAPLLNGVSGSGVTWLDALLSGGFNSVSVSSITAVGNIATVTFTGAHGFTADDVLTGMARLAGANETDYNGDWPLTAVTSTSIIKVQLATSPGVTTATGTITGKRAPIAGWSKAFAGTNKAAYKMPSDSNGHYLRIDDNAVDSGRCIQVRGYRTMSDVDTGTGVFPEAAQTTNWLWHKSATANSTYRPWVVASDGKFLLICLCQGGTTSVAASSIFETVGFGQAISFNPNDKFFTVLGGATNGAGGSPGASFTNLVGACYCAGDINGNPGALVANCTGGFGVRFSTDPFTNMAYGSNTVTAENIAVSLEMQMISPLEARGQVPGWRQGLYQDTVNTSGTYKSDFVDSVRNFFRVMQTRGASYNVGSSGFIDVTGPWR